MANRITLATTIIAVPNLTRLGRRASLTTRSPSPARTISRQITTALEKGRKPSGGTQPKPQRQSFSPAEAAVYAYLNNRKGANRQMWSPGAVRSNPALVGPYRAFVEGGKSQKLEWEALSNGERIIVRLRSSVLSVATGLATRGYEILGRRAGDIKRVAAVYVAKHRRARNSYIKSLATQTARRASQGSI